MAKNLALSTPAINFLTIQRELTYLINALHTLDSVLANRFAIPPNTTKIADMQARVIDLRTFASSAYSQAVFNPAPPTVDIAEIHALQSHIHGTQDSVIYLKKNLPANLPGVHNMWARLSSVVQSLESIAEELQTVYTNHPARKEFERYHGPDNPDEDEGEAGSLYTLQCYPPTDNDKGTTVEREGSDKAYWDHY